MSGQNIAEQIGQAWINHRAGRNKEALVEFDRLTKEAPHDADAHYGLGLVQRAMGHPEAAARAFQLALEIVNKALQERAGEDRYEILQRMLNQRLAEANKQIGGQQQ